LPQPLRQLGDIDRDPARLVAGMNAADKKKARL
jgi:hypothetical protein